MAGAGPTAKHTIVLLQETGKVQLQTLIRVIDILDALAIFRPCAVLCSCCSDWQFHEGAVGCEVWLLQSCKIVQLQETGIS